MAAFWNALAANLLHLLGRDSPMVVPNQNVIEKTSLMSVPHINSLLVKSPELVDTLNTGWKSEKLVSWRWKQIKRRFNVMCFNMNITFKCKDAHFCCCRCLSLVLPANHILSYWYALYLYLCQFSNSIALLLSVYLFESNEIICNCSISLSRILGAHVLTEHHRQWSLILCLKTNTQKLFKMEYWWGEMSSRCLFHSFAGG